MLTTGDAAELLSLNYYKDSITKDDHINYILPLRDDIKNFSMNNLKATSLHRYALYEAKNRPRLHVSFNNSATTQSTSCHMPAASYKFSNRIIGGNM